MTQGMQTENEIERIKLAQLHGDLDAIAIIQERLTMILGIRNPGRTDLQKWERELITFEGKKHLWNMLSRLTSRVESVIISDRGLLREVIHLAAKGGGAHD